jgi:hypothetical protein
MPSRRPTEIASVRSRRLPPLPRPHGGHCSTLFVSLRRAEIESAPMARRGSNKRKESQSLTEKTRPNSRYPRLFHQPVPLGRALAANVFDVPSSVKNETDCHGFPSANREKVGQSQEERSMISWISLSLGPGSRNDDSAHNRVEIDEGCLKRHHRSALALLIGFNSCSFGFDLRRLASRAALAELNVCGLLCSLLRLQLRGALRMRESVERSNRGRQGCSHPLG